MKAPVPSVRIWDLPTRVFHWALACTILGAITTAKLEGRWMDWHVRLGIAALALLVFRLIWGLFGPRYARFSQFVRSPLTTRHNLRSSGQPAFKHAGHNPLGAWSVVAMLLILLIQGGSGLFSNDDISIQGPFVQFVSDTTSALFTRIHTLNEKPVFAIIGLHLIAILVYSIKGHGLVKPMLTGDVPATTLAPQTPSARDDFGVRVSALVLAVALSAAAWWLMQLAANAPSFN